MRQAEAQCDRPTRYRERADIPSRGLGAERKRLVPRQRAGIDLLMRSTMSGGTKFTSSVLSASTSST